MADLREARRAAARVGLGLQYVLKEYRVFDIWSRLSPWLLSEEAKAEAVIVCKGGTTLNKVFLAGAQRFSEDLDFDAFFTNTQLGRGAKVALLHDRLTTLSDVYEVDRPRLMREVAQFTCAFTNELGMKDSVFVEFNMEAKRVGRVEVREARSVIVQSTPIRLRVYSLETLLAKKMKAFYDRGSGKDLYDIHEGLKVGADRGALAEVLREVVASEVLDYDGFARRLLGRLSDEGRLRRLHASTNPYIPRALRLDWVAAGRWLKEELTPLLVPDRSLS